MPQRFVSAAVDRIVKAIEANVDAFKYNDFNNDFKRFPFMWYMGEGAASVAKVEFVVVELDTDGDYIEPAALDCYTGYKLSSVTCGDNQLLGLLDSFDRENLETIFQDKILAVYESEISECALVKYLDAHPEEEGDEDEIENPFGSVLDSSALCPGNVVDDDDDLGSL